MAEMSATQWMQLRLEAEIARRVYQAEGHLPRPRPQAPEPQRKKEKLTPPTETEKVILP